MTLEIQDLHVKVSDVEVIKGVSLKFERGTTQALMGPNGSGKSSLSLALAGHPKYTITKGRVIMDGVDLATLSVDERARAGLFLSFQTPCEVEGVTISSFLRTAVNTRKEKKYSVLEFHKLLLEKMAQLQIDPLFARRSLNVGFSGGEKKRLEMLQLLLLEPKYALLDETDSGLDVDALRTVAQGIRVAQKQLSMGIVVITHYTRFLEYLQPEVISILAQGKIVKTGGKELAQVIEKKGFEPFLKGVKE